MTFKTICDRVKFTLGMSEIVDNDEEALIQQWVNEGVVDIIARTRPYARVINLTVQPNTAAHDMATTIIALMDVELPGVGFLDRYSREDIRTVQQHGGYGFAYEEPLFWLSPIVSQETTIRAYGVFRPTDMAGDDDDPATATFGGLAEEFHPAIVNYACWKAGEYVQHDQSQAGEKWRVMYEGADGTGGDIAKIKRILAKRVTPQGARRRDLTRHLGALSRSGSYMGG